MARALLESWQVVDEVVEAIHTYQTLNQAAPGGSVLPDVLAAAAIMNAHRDPPAAAGRRAARAAFALAPGLTASDCAELRVESAAEMTSLRAALGR